MKHRNSFIILGVLLLLVVCAFNVRPRAESSTKDFTSFSTESKGVNALYRWLGTLDYDVQRLQYREFELGSDDDLLIVVNPSTGFSSGEAQELLDWVEQGNSALIADSHFSYQNNSRVLLDMLDIKTQAYTNTIAIAQPSQPVFDQYPFEDIIVDTDTFLASENNQLVPLLHYDNHTVLGGLKYGNGYLYLSTSSYIFSNNGLRNPESAQLIQTMLRRVPAGGRILFDEYHHGYYTPPRPSRPMAATPWGWSIAYISIACALFFILGGRRFGRPVPLKSEQIRRSSVEYIESMANLFERSEKRDYIQQHYYDSLKRQLAKPYGINPKLPDADFVTELTLIHNFDKQTLLSLLKRLQQTQKSEADLLHLIRDTETFLHDFRST